jgi:hypothetical protein
MRRKMAVFAAFAPGIGCGPGMPAPRGGPRGEPHEARPAHAPGHPGPRLPRRAARRPSAAGKGVPHWPPHGRIAAVAPRTVERGAARTGIRGRAGSRHRKPLGGGAARKLARPCCRTGPAEGRRDRHLHHTRHPGGQGGHRDHPDHHDGRGRPGGRRGCREPRPTGGERHGLGGRRLGDRPAGVGAAQGGGPTPGPGIGREGSDEPRTRAWPCGPGGARNRLGRQPWLDRWALWRGSRPHPYGRSSEPA